MNKYIYLWFPVLPFIIYWLSSIFLYEFGPFNTPDISISTILYILLCIFLFSYAYGKKINVNNYSYKKLIISRPVLLKLKKHLNYFIFFSMIGNVLFVIDKYITGAGSIDLVINEFQYIREDYVKNTSILTTIAVIPQSLRLCAIGLWFYFRYLNIKISKINNIMIILSFLFELFNMVISANRGSLYWDIMLFVFYLIFIQRYKALDIINPIKNMKLIIIIIFIFSIFYSYSTWVAENRVEESTAVFLGEKADNLLKSNTDMDVKAVGSSYQLFYYLTHGITNFNLLIDDAPVINIDVIASLGGRFKSQLQKIFPNYENYSDVIIFNSYSKHGIEISEWASVFGVATFYFGIIGAPIFFYTLGAYCSKVLNEWFKYQFAGYLIIIVVIYIGMCSSFSWFVRDFDQIIGIIYGIYIARIQKNNP